jgi:hypothetical protein
MSTTQKANLFLFFLGGYNIFKEEIKQDNKCLFLHAILIRFLVPSELRKIIIMFKGILDDSMILQHYASHLYLINDEKQKLSKPFSFSKHKIYISEEYDISFVGNQNHQRKIMSSFLLNNEYVIPSQERFHNIIRLCFIQYKFRQNPNKNNILLNTTSLNKVSNGEEESFSSIGQKFGWKYRLLGMKWPKYKIPCKIEKKKFKKMDNKTFFYELLDYISDSNRIYRMIKKYGDEKYYNNFFYLKTLKLLLN